MRKTPLILMAAALPMAVNAANTEFSYGGYIKLDAMYSEYSDGDLGAESAGRDFYIPATIPVGGKKTSGVDFNAKSSRFNFKTVTDLENGQKITTFVEMDFLLAPGGDERISNSYNPRLRHAFVKTGDWLFGQTWSTFMNVGALPETVDFLGVSDGTVFARQAMIRYTAGDFQVALENPETTVYNAPAGSLNGQASDDADFPDIVARYNLKAGKHSFAVSAIARSLKLEHAAANVDESTNGFGVSFSGKIQLGKDDLKFSVTNGNVSRYVGLGVTRDVSYDAANSKLEATKATAAFVGYRHFWTDQLRSSVIYSMLDTDHDDSAGTAVTKKTDSVRVNLMYSPVKKLTYGVEYSQANRELENGTDGSQSRIHFTTKYAF